MINFLLSQRPQPTDQSARVAPNLMEHALLLVQANKMSTGKGTEGFWDCKGKLFDVGGVGHTSAGDSATSVVLLMEQLIDLMPISSLILHPLL